ncbi:mechanosensitive ion channel family protein [Gemmatimonadota bacterium]
MDLNSLLSWTFLENTLTQWAISLGLALLAVIILRVISSVLIRRLEDLTKRTKTDLDDLVIELLRKTKTLFVVLVAVWFGSKFLILTPVVDTWIRHILVVGLLIQGALWATGVVNFLLSRYRKQQVEEDPSLATALGALGVVARMLVWAVFLLLILQNLGIQITALVTTLGIGGIAVALAVQNVLGDLLGSLSIVLDKPFVIGDFIVVGDFRGTVEHVGLKTTRVRAQSGEQLVFSNSDLLASRIQNFKNMNERRAVFTLGVTYDTGHDKLKRIPSIIREVVEAQENTRFDRSHFKGFGDFALSVETVFYMLVPDYTTFMDVQQTINLELYRRFEEEGIQFAFPTQTLFVQKES